MNRAWIVSIGLALGVSSVALATSYDGNWKVVTGSYGGGRLGNNCPAVTIAMTVQGNSLSATIGTAIATLHYRTSIAADGSFATQGGGGTKLSGKFHGDSVDAGFSSNQCQQRTGTGSRVP